MSEHWRERAELVSLDWLGLGENVTAELRVVVEGLRTQLQEAERARDLAIAHDTQPYPTAWAYEQACKALEEQRSRADALGSQVAAVKALAEGYDATGYGSYQAVADDIRAALESRLG